MDDLDAPRTCSECGCDFCFTATARAVTTHWWHVVLECPNCWQTWSRVLDDEALEQVEHALDDDVRLLAGHLNEVGRAGMRSDVARLVTALRADAILPMDF